MFGLDPNIGRHKTSSLNLDEIDPRVEPEGDGRRGSRVNLPTNWSKNRRTAHLVTLAGEDHDRRGRIAAPQVDIEAAAEIAVASVRSYRWVQRAALLAMKYAGTRIANGRHSLRVKAQHRIALDPRRIVEHACHRSLIQKCVIL